MASPPTGRAPGLPRRPRRALTPSAAACPLSVWPGGIYTGLAPLNTVARAARSPAPDSPRFPPVRHRRLHHLVRAHLGPLRRSIPRRTPRDGREAARPALDVLRSRPGPCRSTRTRLARPRALIAPRLDFALGGRPTRGPTSASTESVDEILPARVVLGTDPHRRGPPLHAHPQATRRRSDPLHRRDGSNRIAAELGRRTLRRRAPSPRASTRSSSRRGACAHLRRYARAPILSRCCPCCDRSANVFERRTDPRSVPLGGALPRYAHCRATAGGNGWWMPARARARMPASTANEHPSRRTFEKYSRIAIRSAAGTSGARRAACSMNPDVRNLRTCAPLDRFNGYAMLAPAIRGGRTLALRRMPPTRAPSFRNRIRVD